MPNVLKHIETLKKPAWVFWRSRTAAFQALGDMGQEATDECLQVLKDLLCDSRTKPAWRLEATVALMRIGPRAASVVPAIEACLCNLHGEWEKVSVTATCMIRSIAATAGIAALAELLCRPALRGEVKLVIADRLANDEVDATPALQPLVRCLENLASESELSEGVAYGMGTRIVTAIASAQAVTVSDIDGLVRAMENLGEHPSLSGLCFEILVKLLNPRFPTWFVASGKTEPADFIRWWTTEGRTSAMQASGSQTGQPRTSGQPSSTGAEGFHMSPDADAGSESARKAKEWWQSPASATSRARGYAICDEINCGAHIPPGEGHIRKNSVAELVGLNMPPEIVCDRHKPIR